MEITDYVASCLLFRELIKRFPGINTYKSFLRDFEVIQ